MNNMVQYKGEWLAKNSNAYRLWEEKKFPELDKHLKQLYANEQELVKRYNKE